MAVRLDAGPDAVELPTMTGYAAHRVVREALTNAARYAPGAPVTVTLARHGDRVEVSVVNEPAPAGPLPGPPSHGSGLLALGERVRLAGGTLHAGPRDTGGYAVLARLPLAGTSVGGPPGLPVGPGGMPLADLAGDPGLGDSAPVDRADGPGSPGPWPADRPAEAARRLREARRRVRHSLLVALGAPAGLGLVLSLVYYPFATAGAVLDEAAFGRMRLGVPRAALDLPRRQAEPPAVPARPGCEYFTDGNFPLAEPTWRLCFSGGRLVSKERIAE